MNNAARLHYLKTMGIDVWLPRATAAEASPLLTEHQEKTSLPSSQPLMPSDDWQALEAEVAGCTRCGLCQTRTQTVFGTGNRQADWLFIGEGPGQHEDEQGKPFVGKAGTLLTEMIRAIGLDREEVFITNVIKCRPPGNRDPHTDETASCHPFLQRQIQLIEPKIIVALGRIAAQKLLQTDMPISKLRGKVHTFDNLPLVVVYHPAYLLRSLLEKRKAWDDLQFAVHTFKATKD